MSEIKRNTNNEKLIKAVNYLRLEFPVVEIADKMNMDKGNISSYLNNKKSVSSNFIKKFEAAFNIDTSNFENKPETKNPPQNESGFSIQQHYDNILKHYVDLADRLQKELNFERSKNNKI